MASSHTSLTSLFASLLLPLALLPHVENVTPAADLVEAVDFTSQVVYRSQWPPGYAAWVSFFPGADGDWYIGCEEVSRPERPLGQTSPQQWYGMGLPAGYDKSQYLLEAVLLKSSDDLATWQVVSREPYRHQHSVHQFASARTLDGRLLRFNWACYALDPAVPTNAILKVSQDEGKTWNRAAPFLLDRFAYYPHRLRTLADGTLVLCLCVGPRWGEGTDRPLRTAIRLDTNNELKMTLFFGFDQGRSWHGPLPIFDGLNVSETDFVELADGNLLFFNNSIFARPGRQFVYRDRQRFMSGPLEFVHSGSVPETVCRTKDGLLVGCMRPGSYYCSDDSGATWNPLAGIPDRGPEVYQPWIHALDDGRIVCAGHYGYDDPISTGRKHENYINLHAFRLRVHGHRKDTAIHIERDYDPARRRWLNAYTIHLAEDGKPLAGREVEFWYVERDQPGYDSYNASPLAERMRAGGTLIRSRTDEAGQAHVPLPERFDAMTDQHLSYQVVARFNADGADAGHKPCQSPQMEFYAFAPMPAPLEPAAKKSP